jgi:hypothetical protein
MKGLEMNLVNLVILVIALAILTFVVFKLVPVFGSFVSNSLKGIKASLCKSMGLAGWMFGC